MTEELAWCVDLDTEMCENCGNDFTDHCPGCYGCYCHDEDHTS